MIIAVLYDCCPFTGWDFHLFSLPSKLFAFRVFVFQSLCLYLALHTQYLCCRQSCHSHQTQDVFCQLVFPHFGSSVYPIPFLILLIKEFHHGLVCSPVLFSNFVGHILITLWYSTRIIFPRWQNTSEFNYPYYVCMSLHILLIESAVLSNTFQNWEVAGFHQVLYLWAFVSLVQDFPSPLTPSRG